MINVDDYLNYCRSLGLIQKGDLVTGWFEFPDAFPGEENAREACEWISNERVTVIIPKLKDNDEHLIWCSTLGEFKRFIEMAMKAYRTNMVKLQNRMIERALKNLD